MTTADSNAEREEASLPRHHADARDSRGDGRSAARLMAVQALYQMDLTSSPVETVAAEFLSYRLEPDTDRGLFLDLLRGVASDHEGLSALVAEALRADRSIGRLEIVLRAILRSGAFELRSLADVPARVIINEYVDVAHAFYGGAEPGLVNAVLDRLAHTLRGREFGDIGDDQASEAG